MPSGWLLLCALTVLLVVPECHGGQDCGSCPCGRKMHACGSCSDCGNAHYKGGSNQVSSCSACNAGYHGNGATRACSHGAACTACAQGTYSSAGWGSCKACAIGTYQDQTTQGSCKQCSAGTVQPLTGQASCNSCQPGEYQDLAAQGTCKLCPPGTYTSTTGQASCAQCPKGYIQPESGKASCTACPAGYYSEIEGGVICNPCPVVTYAPVEGSWNCTACPDDTTARSTGSSACEPCGGGTYQPTGAKTCSLCEKGTYSTYKMVASGCTQCPMGKFQDTIGQTTCKSCPVGEFAGQTGLEKCIPCFTGSYQDETGAVECKDCPLGTWQDTTGNTSCVECAVGEYTEAVRSRDITYCKACEVAHAVPTVIPRICSVCPRNSYSNAGALQVRATGCVDCPAHHFFEYGLLNSSDPAACQECKLGWYATGGVVENESKRNIYCKECPGLKYSDTPNAYEDTSCKYCPDGMGGNSSLVGQSSWEAACHNCTAGYYGLNSVCYTCLRGRYCPLERTGYGDMELCHPGWHGPNLGATNASDCIICPVGYDTRGQSGFEACTICPPGQYADKNGTASCSLCGVGEFQTQAGSTGCSSCPARSTTQEKGSIALQSCECEVGTYGLLGTNSVSCKACPRWAKCEQTAQAAPRLSIGYWKTSIKILKTYTLDTHHGQARLDEIVWNPFSVPKLGSQSLREQQRTASSLIVEVMDEEYTVMRCLPALACPSSDGTCAEGYEGDACSSCVSNDEKKYYRASSMCVECSNDLDWLFGSIESAIGDAAIAFPTIFTILSMILTTCCIQLRTCICDKKRKGGAGFVGFGSFKINTKAALKSGLKSVAYFQLFAVVAGIDLPWPGGISGNGASLNLFNLNVDYAFQTGCFSSSLGTKLYGVMALARFCAPIGILIGIFPFFLAQCWVGYVCRGKLEPSEVKTRRKPGIRTCCCQVLHCPSKFLPSEKNLRRNHATKNALNLMLIGYMVLHKNSMDIFACKEQSEGRYQLIGEPSIQCTYDIGEILLPGEIDFANWAFLVKLALIGVVVYSITIPAVTFVLVTAAMSRSPQPISATVTLERPEEQALAGKPAHSRSNSRQFLMEGGGDEPDIDDSLFQVNVEGIDSGDINIADYDEPLPEIDNSDEPKMKMLAPPPPPPPPGDAPPPPPPRQEAVPPPPLTIAPPPPPEEPIFSSSPPHLRQISSQDDGSVVVADEYCRKDDMCSSDENEKNSHEGKRSPGMKALRQQNMVKSGPSLIIPDAEEFWSSDPLGEEDPRRRAAISVTTTRRKAVKWQAKVDNFDPTKDLVVTKGLPVKRPRQPLFELKDCRPNPAEKLKKSVLQREIEFLVEPYKWQFQWWEIVVKVYQSLVGVTLCFSVAGSDYVCIMILALSIVYLALTSYCLPFKDDIANVQEIFMSLSLVVMSVLGLCAIAQDSISSQVYSAVLNLMIVTHGTTLMLLFVGFLYDILPPLREIADHKYSDFRAMFYDSGLALKARVIETYGDVDESAGAATEWERVMGRGKMQKTTQQVFSTRSMLEYYLIINQLSTSKKILYFLCSCPRLASCACCLPSYKKQYLIPGQPKPPQDTKSFMTTVECKVSDSIHEGGKSLVEYPRPSRSSPEQVIHPFPTKDLSPPSVLHISPPDDVPLKIPNMYRTFTLNSEPRLPGVHLRGCSSSTDGAAPASAQDEWGLVMDLLKANKHL